MTFLLQPGTHRTKPMKTAIVLSAALAAALPVSAAVLSYSYDPAGRLTRVNYGGTSHTAYGYDKNGNRLSHVDTTNPLPPLAANYTGLITNATPAVGNTGLVTLKLGPTGAFTGKFTFGGKSHGFSGTFAADGSTPAIVVAGFTLTLALDVAGGTQQVTGTITDGAFTSAVVLDRARFDKKTNPLPAGLASKYTMLFQATEATPGIPQGDGFATLTLDAAGSLRAAGSLADGSKISQGTVLAGGAVWPLFIPLYNNAGYLAGSVVFAGNPGASDFAGTPDWVKPATTGPLHPGAFTTELALIGSKYDPPAKGQRALDLTAAVPNATFTADLALPLALDVTLDTKNKFLIPAGPAKLKLTLAAPTGLLSGSFLDGATTRKFGGVLFQEQNAGAGFFPGTSESGLIELESKP